MNEKVQPMTGDSLTKEADIFEKEGVPIEVGGNRPFLLSETGKVRIVRSGKVNVFAVRLKDGAPAGPRTHFFSVCEGDALFGMNSVAKARDGELGLLAVGARGTVLWECDRSRLMDLSADPVHRQPLAALIDGWVENLTSGLCKSGTPSGKYGDLEISPEFNVYEAINLRFPNGTVWVRALQGRLFLLGCLDWPEAPPASYFPLSRHAWLYTDGECALSVSDTESFLGEDGSWPALDRFNEHVLSCLSIVAGRAEDAERERLARKRRTERLNLDHTLLRFGSILQRKKKTLIVSDSQDHLLAACRVVGDALGIRVRPPHDGPAGNQALRVEDIARASGFRLRQVILRDEWWRSDNGPMLGYREEDRRPVALLPSSARGYDLFDPSGGAKEKVSPKTVGSLAPFAITFYRPFPQRTLSGKDMIRFALRGCSRDIVMMILMGLCGALLGLLTPLMTGYIFDTVIPEAARGRLIQIGVILVTCAFATAMFEVTKGIALLRAQGRMEAATQCAFWDRILSLPVPFFRKYTAGDLAQRGMGISVIRHILSSVTVSTILSCLFSALNLGLLFFYEWKLALVAVALSCVGIFLTGAACGLQVRYRRQINEIEGKNAGTVLQFISGIAKLKVSGTEDHAFAVWADNFAHQQALTYKAGKIANTLSSFNVAFPVLTTMSIFMWMIWMGTEKMSTGSFLAFSAAYAAFQNGLLQMTLALAASLDVIPLYERARPIIETQPELTESKVSPGELNGEIEVSHVCFRYVADGPLVLKGVSLHVGPGEFVALVGASGSGKSTLFRLLLGFEMPESGTIYYDGQDLAAIDIFELRRRIGVVLQNGRLMGGDIFTNIIGTSNLTIDDAWEAARMVGLDEDIQDMPMGMHTVVPPGGGTLSGGQRQRLLIARAIIKKPRILFFDEATSALDNRTQAIVGHSLERLQVTRVVIAHRLSTIINADRVYVLHDGEIVEQGTCDELMRQAGYFADLARRQIA